MATARHNGGERREGLDIGLLAAAALAAVAAAVVTSKLWPGGTLISTALTPVIVALVKEWLRKPAERISAVSAKAPDLAARVVAPTRGAPRVEPQTARAAEAAPPAVPTAQGERVVVPPAGSPAAGTPPEETFVERAPSTASPYRLYRRRSPHWRLAAVTGLLAFAVAALAITVPELVLGGAVAGKGDTTVFGGGSQHSSQAKPDGQNKSDGEQSGDRRTTSQPRQQQSTPKPTSKPTQPSKGSSPSPPTAQQPPSSSGSSGQSPPSTSAPPPPGQGSPSSGSTPPPSGGQ